jgi:hypothetical protein
MSKEFVCCICGEDGEWGANPHPVKDKFGNDFDEYDQCCKKCDQEVVIPLRIKLLEKK